MNIAAQIKAFQDQRIVKTALLEDLLKKSEESGESFDEKQTEEFDGITADIETIDKHIAALTKSAAILATSAAVRLDPATVNTGKAAAAARVVPGSNGEEGKGGVIAVEQKLAPGIGFARFVKFMMAAQGNARDAYEMAKNTYPNERPLLEAIKGHIGQGPSRNFIEKATVDAAITSTSTWAGALVQYQNLANDFIEFLRPQTLLGRIPGFRRVPFKVRVPRQTGGGAASWVGEGRAKPLTSLAFDTVTLDFTKIATIAVLTDEVLRLSTPSAEQLTRDQLAAALIQQMDSDFIDPNNAGSAGVKPASVTNGVTPIVATGTNTQAGIATDLMNLFSAWLANNQDPTKGVLLMTPGTALALSLMTNSLGNKVYPGMSINGGTLEGLPVVVSNTAGLQGASDGAHIVVLMDPSAILLADDGTVAIDASREASLEMSDAPGNRSDTGTGASLVSMFQTNSLAIRAERWVNWVKGRTTAVEMLSAVHWGGWPN